MQEDIGSFFQSEDLSRSASCSTTTAPMEVTRSLAKATDTSGNRPLKHEQIQRQGACTSRLATIHMKLLCRALQVVIDRVFTQGKDLRDLPRSLSDRRPTQYLPLSITQTWIWYGRLVQASHSRAQAGGKIHRRRDEWPQRSQTARVLRRKCHQRPTGLRAQHRHGNSAAQSDIVRFREHGACAAGELLARISHPGRDAPGSRRQSCARVPDPHVFGSFLLIFPVRVEHVPNLLIVVMKLKVLSFQGVRRFRHRHKTAEFFKSQNARAACRVLLEFRQ